MLNKGLLITLVESNLPPKPTSKIVQLALFLENAKKATAVISSKKLSSLFPLAFTHFSNKRLKCFTSIFFPAIKILSVMSTKCGEVNTCTLSPLDSSPAFINATVEPFPFVPAI